MMTPPRTSLDLRTPAVNTRLEPDPARLAGLLVRTWIEVRAGRRPASQLAPLVTPTMLRRLRIVSRRGQGPVVVPNVRRVTATYPTAGVCEAVVTVTWPSQRVSAVAVRLEAHDGRWRAVELTAPESGYTPAPSWSPDQSPAPAPRRSRQAAPLPA